MRQIEEINRDIDILKKEMETLEGTVTEVYTRIVGYYRSVRNWNKGKREEYKFRVPFGLPGEKQTAPLNENAPAARQVQKELFSSVNREAEPVDASRYLYFFRNSCPNCPPVAAALTEMDVPVEKINVDTEEGMEEARKRGVLASPTVIMLDTSGAEVFRTTKVQDLGVREKAGAGI